MRFWIVVFARKYHWDWISLNLLHQGKSGKDKYIFFNVLLAQISKLRLI